MGLLAPAPAQGLELALRSGRAIVAESLIGDGERGYRARVGGAEQSIAADDILAISGVASSAPDLAACYLLGGDVVRGAIVGGDASGNELHWLSPGLGRLVLDVDRLQAVVGRTSPPLARLLLPPEVEEALFVPAAVGSDVIAGTLHQFGDAGVRFQAEGAAAPRWYGPNDFTALRLGAATAPPPPPFLLMTRAAERVGASSLRCDSAGVAATLAGGAEVSIPWRDLAAVHMHGAAICVADMPPREVSESGYAGEVVWPWQRDHNVLGGPLVAGGRTFARGIGAHAKSRLVFEVPKAATHFWTRVGCDDSATALPLQPIAEARVVVGTAVAFRAEGLRPGSAPRDSGPIAVQPGQLLALEVDFAAGRDLGDRVDWLLPVFLTSAAKKP
jgi:hypothetical protein